MLRLPHTSTQYNTTTVIPSTTTTNTLQTFTSNFNQYNPMTNTTTIVDSLAGTTNFNDHIVGHCRAQRHSLYCHPHIESCPHVDVSGTTTPKSLNEHMNVDHCHAQQEAQHCHTHIEPSAQLDLDAASRTAIGHCRAQRQALYCCPHSGSTTPVGNATQANSVVAAMVTLEVNDNDWTESREELGRWGMVDVEIATPKVEGELQEGKVGELKFGEVENFWQ
jgi:hypothetical protein